MTKRPDRLTYREALDHIRQHHPRCPGPHAHQIIMRVLGRSRWQGVRLGEAVGVEIQNYVRHQLTSDDKLLTFQGLERREARSLIRDKVRKIITKWDRPKKMWNEPTTANADNVLPSKDDAGPKIGVRLYRDEGDQPHLGDEVMGDEGV